MSGIRVRFAPSPTGPLHVGGARTALYNWLHAKSQGGTFVLRIEDTDRERSTEEALRHILEGLSWLSITWDEGPGKDGAHAPYFQSQKFARYREKAEQLLASGHAYRCFCSEEEIEAGRQALVAAGGKPMYDRRCRRLSRDAVEKRLAAGDAFSVRFAMEEGTRVLDDRIKGKVEVNLKELDDWVMLRRDGSPLYNFCCVVDDVDMRITDVIRGEEHFYNGVKQLLLYEAFGEEPPRFAHIPLILGKDRKKLSKRLAQTNLLDYRDQGYPADAVVNFLALLGWGYDASTEIFTREQMLERFKIDDISTGGSMFDEEKLDWMCGVYVRAMDRPRLLSEATPFLTRAGIADEGTIARHRAFFENVVACAQDRVFRFVDLPPKVAHIFAERVEPDEKARPHLEASGARALLSKYREALAGLALPPSFPADRKGADTAVVLPSDKHGAAEGAPFLPPKALEESARKLAEGQGLKFAQLVHPLRAALTGSTAGPSLFDVVYLLGREKVLARLSAATG